jgi:hypothetical protein
MKSTMKYTPAQLRAQVSLMHPAAHEGGACSTSHLLSIGLGAGMLSVAADQLQEATTLLRICEAYLTSFNLQYPDTTNGGLVEAIQSIGQFLDASTSITKENPA